MRYIIIVSLLLASPAGFAGSKEDEHTQKALQQTQELLRDKDKRDKAAKENEKARAADDYVNKIGADRDGTYDLAAEIMADLVKKTNGDPKAMQELMEKAQRDPAAFGKSLSPEQIKKIQELARPIAPPVNQQ